MTKFLNKADQKADGQRFSFAGESIASGAHIYGPFEAGFTSQQDSNGKSEDIKRAPCSVWEAEYSPPDPFPSKERAGSATNE